MAEEKNFENRVKQWLRSKCCYVVKYYGCGGTRAGVPDLLVCANGRFVGVEIKAEHGKLAPLQRSHLDKILTSGGAVTVLRPSEFDGFKKFIEEVLNDD